MEGPIAEGPGTEGEEGFLGGRLAELTDGGVGMLDEKVSESHAEQMVMEGGKAGHHSGSEESPQGRCGGRPGPTARQEADGIEKEQVQVG